MKCASDHESLQMKYFVVYHVDCSYGPYYISQLPPVANTDAPFIWKSKYFLDAVWSQARRSVHIMSQAIEDKKSQIVIQMA